MNIESVLNLFQARNIELKPAGIWKFNEENCQLHNGKASKDNQQATCNCSKEAIDPFRNNTATWAKYSQDNMAKHFITKEQNILVVDVDGEEVVCSCCNTNYVECSNDDKEIYIPSIGLTLPNTFYTTTTKRTKYHIYYKVDDSSVLPNRMVKPPLKTSNDNSDKHIDIDFFTYGLVFDMHFYSPNATVNGYTLEDINNLDFDTTLIPHITTLDSSHDLHKLLINLSDELNIATEASQLNVMSNITRYNLTKAFVDDELTSNKSWNAFFKAIFPNEYIPQNKKKLTFDDFDLSYDLINKVLVKLTTTAELGYNEHVIPAIRKILDNFGINPDSKQSRGILYRQMLPSLPQHSPETPYTLNDDALTIAEHIEKQNTATPVFKVLVDSRPKYIQLDRFTLEPIEHNGTYLLEETAARETNPERNQYREDGKIASWDNQVPIIYLTDDPYKPSVYVDEDTNRNVVNLYKRTKYLKEAEPVSQLSDSNIIYKLMKSSIHPDYLDLVMKYQAQVVFGNRAPVMVLWMASLKSDIGGTGKSLITIDLFSKMLGTAAVVVTSDDMTGNWGDVLVGARIISLEDLANLSSREFDKLYGSIKQATSSAQKRLNMKGSHFRTQQLNICITGSSNERIGLHNSDRRFLCLEPAHLRGDTEPLNDEEAIALEKFRSSQEHNADMQEYTNYLLYLSMQELSDEDYRSIFISPPATPYRTKWVTSNQTNTANVSTLLTTPWGLHDMVRVDDMNEDVIVELYSLVVETYSKKTGKTALPWNWFAELLPFIQTQKHGDVDASTYSKAQVSKMLSIDFTVNVGELYHGNWKRKWKQSGYVFAISEVTLNEYKEIINSILNGADSKPLEQITTSEEEVTL